MISLRQVSLQIREEFLFSVSSYDFLPGKKILLVGDNGTGKSSLMKSLIRRFDYVTGDIDVKGEVVYQPQEPYLFQKTVRDNLKLCGVAREEMIRGLEALYAEDILDKKVRVLSGGQRQKTALLRSLAKAKDILLLDEPFSQMDERSTVAAQRMVDKWHQERKGRILVVISHDVELSAMTFHEKIYLRDQAFYVETLE